MSAPKPSPQNKFAEGYRAALSDVIGLSVQHWPDEAKPSITKFIAQVRNCLYPARNVENRKRMNSTN